MFRKVISAVLPKQEDRKIMAAVTGMLTTIGMFGLYQEQHALNEFKRQYPGEKPVRTYHHAPLGGYWTWEPERKKTPTPTSTPKPSQ